MAPTYFEELVEDHMQTSASYRRMLLLCLAISVFCLLCATGLYFLTPFLKDQQWHNTGLILLLALGAGGVLICSVCLLWLRVSARFRLLIGGLGFIFFGLLGFLVLPFAEDVGIFEMTFESILSLAMLAIGLIVVGAWLIHRRNKSIK